MGNGGRGGSRVCQSNFYFKIIPLNDYEGCLEYNLKYISIFSACSEPIGISLQQWLGMTVIKLLF